MENSFTKKSWRRTVIVCGTGGDVGLFEEAFKRHGSPIQIYPEFNTAAEVAARNSPCVLLAERECITGLEASKTRLRLTLMPGIHILAIGAESSYSDPAALLRMGVVGFVEPNSSLELLEKVFECVESGELWVTRRLLAEMVSTQPAASASLLTRRELEILKRMAAGNNNRQIADALFVTRDTVRWHLRSVYAKLGVHNRRAASELLWLGAEGVTASCHNGTMSQSA